MGRSPSWEENEERNALTDFTVLYKYKTFAQHGTYTRHTQTELTFSCVSLADLDKTPDGSSCPDWESSMSLSVLAFFLQTLKHKTKDVTLFCMACHMLIRCDYNDHIKIICICQNKQKNEDSEMSPEKWYKH